MQCQRPYDLVKKRGMIACPEAPGVLGLSEAEVRREFATRPHLEILRAQKPHEQVLVAWF